MDWAVFLIPTLIIILVNTNIFHTPCKDGHGLFDVDVDDALPCFSAVVKEVMTGEDMLSAPNIRITKIYYRITKKKSITKIEKINIISIL